MNLVGTFKTPSCEGKFDHLIFDLVNYHPSMFRVAEIKFDEEPMRHLLVTDIRVGKNSQFLCPGSFKASILSRVRDFPLDTCPVGLSIAIQFSTSKYHPDCRITIEGKKEQTGSRMLDAFFPEGTAQSKGKVDKIVTTGSLFQAVEKGEITLSLVQRPDVPAHQEVPVATYEIVVKDGCLRLKSPALFSPGTTYRFAFARTANYRTDFVEAKLVPKPSDPSLDFDGTDAVAIFESTGT